MSDRPTPRTDAAWGEARYGEDPNAVYKEAIKLERELAESKAENERLQKFATINGVADLERQLAEAKEAEASEARWAAQYKQERDTLAKGLDAATTAGNLLAEQRDRLAEAMKEIHELAGWHTDDNADPDDQCPDDAVAHYNGLIRQKSLAAVKGGGQ